MINKTENAHIILIALVLSIHSKYDVYQHTHLYSHNVSHSLIWMRMTLDLLGDRCMHCSWWCFTLCFVLEFRLWIWHKLFQYRCYVRVTNAVFPVLWQTTNWCMRTKAIPSGTRIGKGTWKNTQKIIHRVPKFRQSYIHTDLHRFSRCSFLLLIFFSFFIIASPFFRALYLRICSVCNCVV